MKLALLSSHSSGNLSSPAPTDWRTDGAETRWSILVLDQPPASHQKCPAFLTSVTASTSEGNREMLQAVLCYVIPDLTEAKSGR